MTDLLNWFIYQWTPSTMSQGTWYNVPALLLGGFSIILGLGAGIYAFFEEDRDAARAFFILVFLVPLLAVFWPVIVPLVLLALFVYMIRLAW